MTRTDNGKGVDTPQETDDGDCLVGLKPDLAQARRALEKDRLLRGESCAEPAPAAATTLRRLPIDTAQARQLLLALGYSEDEPIFLRKLARKGSKGIRPGGNFSVKIGTLPTEQESDQGFFFVVNGDGQKGAEVVTGRALWIEYDFGSHDEQSAIIKARCAELGIPEPLIWVCPRRSLHCYWPLTEALPIEDWEPLQKAFMACFPGSDQSVGDPSRIMRLAGGWHTQEKDGQILEPLRCDLFVNSNSPESLNGNHFLKILKVGNAAIAERDEQKKASKPGVGNGKAEAPARKKAQPRKPAAITGSRISDSLRELERRLSLEDLFDWSGHDFQERSGSPGEFDGCCPWHESKSGTSFSVTAPGAGNNSLNVWAWYCRGCGVGGDWLSYQHALEAGLSASMPEGSEFVELAKELAAKHGWELPAKPRSEWAPNPASLPDSALSTGPNEFWLLPESEKSQKISGGQFYSHIQGAYGSRLRFNERSQAGELDGEPLDDLETAYIGIQSGGYSIQKEAAIDAIMRQARKHKYDPIRDEFDSIPPYDPGYLDGAAARHFGTTGPGGIYNAYLKRTLIALMARTYDPGCKVDTVMILKGPQGKQKSWFWESLVRKENFCDDVGDLSDKDNLLKAHRFAVVEWAELDHITGVSHAGKLKGQITTKIDNIRPPYGRAAKPFPRKFIIVGTTNEDRFLHDPTGDRRYWVVELPKGWSIERIDEAERLRLLGAAKALYQAGEQWWLTNEEESLRLQANEAYRSHGKWFELLASKLPLHKGMALTTPRILEDVIGKSPGHWSLGDTRDVAISMRALGYEQKQTSISGSKARFWIKPELDRVEVAIADAPAEKAAHTSKVSQDFTTSPDQKGYLVNHLVNLKTSDSKASEQLHQIHQTKSQHLDFSEDAGAAEKKILSDKVSGESGEIGSSPVVAMGLASPDGSPDGIDLVKNSEAPKPKPGFRSPLSSAEAKHSWDLRAWAGDAWRTATYIGEEADGRICVLITDRGRFCLPLSALAIRGS